MSGSVNNDKLQKEGLEQKAGRNKIWTKLGTDN